MTTYGTLDDLIESLKQPRKRSLKLALRRSWKYGWLRKWFNLRDRYYDIRHFIQRGRRGWSHRDVWSLDHYLAGVIAGSVNRLADTDHGWPQSEKYPTYESFIDDLRKIAGAFELYTQLEELETEDFWDRDSRTPRYASGSPEMKALFEANQKRRQETIDEMRRIFDVWESLWD